MDNLIAPHGSRLVDLMAGGERVVELRESSRDWPSLDLGPRQLCDLELLLSGALSPLVGYMGADDHRRVCSEMRLADGTLWPLTLTLDIPDELAELLSPGSDLAIRDREGVMLARLAVDDVFEPDRRAEARALFGDRPANDPDVGYHLHRTTRFAAAGKVEGVQPPVHFDYRELRLSPHDLRRSFASLGWRRVLAFQTHRTMHRAQQAMTLAAAREAGASVLIHPAVGM
ncbi:MAG: adenylyltransferase, partial [Holophagae bacterium]